MAITPYNESPVIREEADTVNSGSIKTTLFDHVRQGVSVRNPRDFFDGVLPKFNFIFDDAKLEVTSPGDPKQWHDGEPFEDVPRQLPEFVGDTSQSALHPGEVDASLKDPYVKSGIIEPLGIRDEIARKIVYERPATGVKATFAGGNVDNTGAGDVVVYHEDFAYPRPTPFQDSQEEFGLAQPGFVSDPVTLITWFQDHRVDARGYVYEDDDIGSDMAETLSAMYVNATGTFVGDGRGVKHPGFGHDDKGFGFIYAANKNRKVKDPTSSNSIPRLDSHAFGDQQAYTSRGFMRDLDTLVPTRPNKLRLNDERRPGSALPAFDDTITTIFASNVLMDVGRGIEANASNFDDNNTSLATSGSAKIYPYVGQLTYDTLLGTNYDPVIEATGDAVKGIADNWLMLREHSTQQSLYAPFDETRLHDDPNWTFSDFYLTGTAPDVVEGFTSPPRDKTQIVIELPATPKEVLFATASAGDMHSGLVYYNKDLTRWETIGDLTSGPGLDYMSPDPAERGGSMLAFMPSAMLTQTSSLSFLGAGYATSDAGFPVATKFDATSSFTFLMSDYITEPFLLEKCVVDMELEFAGALGLTASMAPRVRQFFILNQYDSPDYDAIVHLAGENSTTGSVTHLVQKQKDLVAVGHISIADTSNSAFDNHYRDLTIHKTEAEVQAGFTGSFTMPFYAGVSPVVGENSTDPAVCQQYRQVRGGDKIAEKNVFGGVNNARLMSERSIVRGVPTKISSSLIPIVNGITENIPSQSYLPAPYLLTPKDNLVFGFANQSISISDVYGPDQIADEDVKIGKCRLRLIGSLVKDEKEYHEGLNQELIYEAIYEDISECVVDQFILHPKNLYSGTYLDDIIEGAMADGTRKVIGSNVSDSCITSSISFSVPLVSTNEYVYDSLLPNPADYHEANGKVFANIFGVGGIILGTPNKTYIDSLASAVDTTWPRAYPFERRYSTLQRNFKLDSFDRLVDLGGSSAPLRALALSASFALDFVVDERTKSAALLPNHAHTFFKTYFGASTTVDDLVETDFGTSLSRISRPHGLKYGIYKASPSRAFASFRHDRYGQFRDMLEQRQYTRIFDSDTGQLLDSSVYTIFSSTLDQSSNRDVHATSSLPYFDGVARN